MSKRKQQFRKQIDQDLFDFADVRERCGEDNWEAAYTAAKDAGFTLATFASTSYDCRKCPLFFRCTLENRFYAPGFDQDFLRDMEATLE